MKLASSLLLALMMACASGARIEKPAPKTQSDSPGENRTSRGMDGASASTSAPAAQEQVSGASVDLGRERALIEEAEAAVKAVDLGTARAKATEAVAALLARVESERDEAWLALVDRTGQAAWEAEDAGTAKRAWEQVFEVRSRTLPGDHPDLQEARLNLAKPLYSLGDLQGARALEEQVLEVRSRTLPGDHPDLQKARLNLAGTIQALGDLDGARALEEQVLEVYSRTLPADHPDLQLARQNLAATLYSLGDLASARALDEQVLEVYSRTLPADHPNLQATRHNLALTMQALGDLAGAGALQEQVLEIFSRTLPADHPNLQAARQGLANTLDSLGDLAGARALFEQVLEVYSHTLPADHPDLQAARLNLAVTIKALDDLHGARALFERVLEVRARTLPADHPDLQAARQGLANTLALLGDLAGARALQEQVLEVYSRTLPADHPDLQKARGSLAVTLCSLGDLVGAQALQEQALEVFSRTLPADHPDLQSARGYLAATIALQARASTAQTGGRERCAKLLLARCRAQSDAARTALLTSSAREAQARCEELGQGLDLSLSFASGYGVFDPIPELDRASFELGETTRGAALGSAALMRRAAGSPAYAELRERSRRESDELAELARQGTTTEGFQAAVAQRDATQRELVRLARGLSGGSPVGVDFDAGTLAERLGPGRAAVAMRRYTRSWVADGKPQSVASLCAMVLARSVAESDSAGSTSTLTRLDLGPIEPIEQAVGSWRAALGAGEGRGVGVSIGAAPLEERPRGEEIRRLVFDPLLPALAGCEHVVVALDDVLHLVPIDALPLDEGAGLVGDRWRIETRCTLPELLPAPQATQGEDVLVALGGADFSALPLAPEEEEREEPDATPAQTTQVASILRGGAYAAGFQPLPYTSAEVREIAAVFQSHEGTGARSIVLEKRRGSRAALTELAPRARFLHVATHGWFAPESIKSWKDVEPLDVKSGLALRQSGEEQVKGMSPMLLCGLALAGANLPDDEFGRVPGLITAEELSTLDLRNCELAVLSACDTNVGVRHAGQGVASLQRALQMAGARSVITSLWKVPDEATKELMLDFYRRLWVEQKPKWQALWEAKLKLRNARSEQGRPLYTTRDWAAWVLTGEPD